MRPISLEQSDTMNRNKTENETTKTRTINATKQRMSPLKLEQSDTLNSKKNENETTKTRTIRYNEQQQNRE
jgi:hypothetical protein